MNRERLFAIAVTAAFLAFGLWCSTSLSADATKNIPSSLPSSAPQEGDVFGAHARTVGQYAYQFDFSTFLGGSGFEDVRGLTLDAQGNIYVCGPTMSRDFPTTPGVHLTKVVGEPGGHGGHQFVAKFNPAGKLIWSTLLGNPEACEFPICMNVKVDAAGFVYVSGGAGPGFPTTPGVFQPKFQPGAPNNANAFVAKLKPDGSGLVWASYVGACQEVRDMDIDDAGDLYLQLGIDEGFQGTLPEAWFANAYQKTPHVHPTTYHEGDTGIIKVSNDGTKVHWATWIGGSKGNITKASVCVGRDHCPVLWMPTMSDDVPTTPGAYCRTMAVPPDADIGGRDGLMWLGKLSADGSCLLFVNYVDCQVDEPPAITAVSLDKDGVFSVAATGTRLNYQWQNRGQGIRHATAAIYVTPRGAAVDPSLYTVVVSNPAGGVSSRGTPRGP